MVAVKNIKKFATQNNSLKQSLPSCVSRVELRTPMNAAITPLVKARTAISMACTTLQSSFSNQNDSLYGKQIYPSQWQSDKRTVAHKGHIDFFVAMT